MKVEELMRPSRVGERVRQLRLASSMSQIDLARALELDGNSAISKIENARVPVEPTQVDQLARALGCTPEFLLREPPAVIVTRPWLRAYADAPARAVDSITSDSAVNFEVVERLGLRRIPDRIPIFDGDENDPEAIESFALEVRAALNIEDDAPISNAARAVENLGCVLLPLSDELGRHLGLSHFVGGVPIIRASRARDNVPGDRQRFTIAHELGHLALHAGRRPPETAEEARIVENQAHRFAGAFLVPREALLADLGPAGRVTLTTLTALKARWGVAIKMLVMRLRQLGVLSETQSASLYKQISKRGWNSGEPVSVENERAVWMETALRRALPETVHVVGAAAEKVGLAQRYLDEWLQWDPWEPELDAELIDLSSRRGASVGDVDGRGGLAPVTVLTRRPGR